MNPNISPEMLQKMSPEMIQKMAQEMAKQHVDKITANMGQNPEEVAASVPPPSESRMPSREQMNITPENAQKVLEKAQTLVCDECNNYTFASVVVVKRVSPIISPTGEEVVLPLQTYQCTNCKHINESFLPASAISDIDKSAIRVENALKTLAKRPATKRKAAPKKAKK